MLESDIGLNKTKIKNKTKCRVNNLSFLKVMVDLKYTCYWFLFEVTLGLLFNNIITCIGLILMNADTGMLICISCEIDFEMAH